MRGQRRWKYSIEPPVMPGAERRSKLLPDQLPAARQAGHCFVALLLAMTVETEAHDSWL